MLFGNGCPLSGLRNRREVQLQADALIREGVCFFRLCSTIHIEMIRTKRYVYLPPASIKVLIYAGRRHLNLSSRGLNPFVESRKNPPFIKMCVSVQKIILIYICWLFRGHSLPRRPRPTKQLVRPSAALQRHLRLLARIEEPKPTTASACCLR